MIDIWEQRVSAPDGVIHGSATRFIAWVRRPDGIWEMRGAFWKRDAAEAACA